MRESGRGMVAAAAAGLLLLLFLDTPSQTQLLVLCWSFVVVGLVAAVVLRRLALRVMMVAFIAVPLLLVALDTSSQAQLLAQSGG